MKILTYIIKDKIKKGLKNLDTQFFLRNSVTYSKITVILKYYLCIFFRIQSYGSLRLE